MVSRFLYYGELLNRRIYYCGMSWILDPIEVQGKKDIVSSIQRHAGVYKLGLLQQFQ